MERDSVRDPVTRAYKFDPRIFGIELSWDEFQAELIAEFDAWNNDMLNAPLPPDTPPDAEFSKGSVFHLLLGPADAIEYCDRVRSRLRCPLHDSIILEVLWQNCDAVDAMQNSQN